MGEEVGDLYLEDLLQTAGDAGPVALGVGRLTLFAGALEERGQGGQDAAVLGDRRRHGVRGGGNACRCWLSDHNGPTFQPQYASSAGISPIRRCDHFVKVHLWIWGACASFKPSLMRARFRAPRAP